MESPDANGETALENILELRSIFKSAQGKLIESRISPDDYFANLSYGPPALKYPELGISKTVVSVCELISTLLLEDIDESKAVSKTIVMIFEYYFLVAPLFFDAEKAKLVNDVTFMRHFMRYVQSLCTPRTQAQQELRNLLVALDLYKYIKEIDTF